MDTGTVNIVQSGDMATATASTDNKDVATPPDDRVKDTNVPPDGQNDDSQTDEPQDPMELANQAMLLADKAMRMASRHVAGTVAAIANMQEADADE